LQHREYCSLLSRFGFSLIVLPADRRYPDSAFVEDAAVVAGDTAIITRPGAAARRGEVEAVRNALAPYKRIEQILPPGCLEGGDVLQVEDRTFVGLTERTNRHGFSQMARLLRETGFPATPVPLKRSLHLKTACNYLGRGLLVVNHLDFEIEIFSHLEIIRADPSEAARLSFLALGESVLVPDDCPVTAEEFERRGWKAVPVGLSEIRKAQAGLTCMSILFEA
ncbi:MAG: N(G),N(G)-dimethylarginine dimethylaminohydrolase, partial [Deltaproteobacteria bacterium]|nr:N(G),N(G)-dimethylarginine dimethylaminohydrolase [Deltaproteobacteria bacterium]